MIQHYAWAPVRLCEDADDATASEADLRGAGTLQLELRRIIVTGRGQNTAHVKAAPGQATFFEGSKKAAAAHAVGLGPAQPQGNRRTYDTTYIDSKNGPPFHTFKFIYRRRDQLEALGIVIGGASPVAPAVAPIAAAPVAGPSQPRAARTSVKVRIFCVELP